MTINFLERKKTDWVGLWFRLMQERGYDTTLYYGKLNENSDQKVEWFTYPHWEMDGLGGIVSLLRQQGLNPTFPELPINRRGNWFLRFKGILAYFRFMPVHGALWKRQFKNSSDTHVTLSNAIVFKCLSLEETTRIVQQAKKYSVSVNSFLLWSLVKATCGEIQEGTGPHYWMIPVNMRGAVWKRPDTSNHLSCIWADTTEVTFPQDVQRVIQSQFESNIHWGNWFVLNIGKWIGEKGMQRLLNRVERIGDRSVGVFSNLGVWNVKSGPWVGFPPVSEAAPLGATTMTFDGRISFGLQSYRSLGHTKESLAQWLGQWIQFSLEPEKSTNNRK